MRLCFDGSPDAVRSECREKELKSAATMFFAAVKEECPAALESFTPCRTLMQPKTRAGSRGNAIRCERVVLLSRSISRPGSDVSDANRRDLREK